jgi:hypothetical protein
MADAGSIEVWLKLNADGFVSGLDKAKIGLTGWRDETNRNTMDIAKWGAAITATVAPLLLITKAAIDATEKYGAMADQITDLALVTGLSTDKIQRLQYTSVLAGQDFSTASIAATKLTLSISGFADSSSAAHKAFDRLGVDPTGKSREQVFDEVARSIYSIKDETERASVASELYGKSWKDMIPFIDAYIEKADEIKEAPVFSDKELQNLKEANIEWQKLSNNITIYSGKALAYLDDINNKYNEIQANNAKNPGPINSFLESMFGSKSGGNTGAGGRGGAITTAASTPLSGAASNQWALDIFGGASEGKQKTQVDLLDDITDAIKKQKEATEDLADEKERLAEIDKDYADTQADLDKEYARSLITTDPRNVQAMMNLNLQHQYAEEDVGTDYLRQSSKQKTNVSTSQKGVEEAGAGVAKAAGDFTVNINGNITFTDGKDFAAKIQSERKKMGGTTN